MEKRKTVSCIALTDFTVIFNEDTIITVELICYPL